jgi:hypothetical protein
MLGGKKLSIVLIILFVSVFIVSGCVDGVILFFRGRLFLATVLTTI